MGRASIVEPWRAGGYMAAMSEMPALRATPSVDTLPILIAPHPMLKARARPGDAG